MTLTAKVRSFVLEGQVLDAAIYEGTGALAGEIAFTTELVKAITLPRGRR